MMEHNDEQQDESESVREASLENNLESSETSCDRGKLSIDIPGTEVDIKCEKNDEFMEFVKMEEMALSKREIISIKEESSMNSDTTVDSKIEYNSSPSEFMKSEEKLTSKRVVLHDFRVNNAQIKKENAIKEEIIEKGTVEIIDQNEPDTEMEEFSSPIAVMESDAILKQRVAEMRLEFGGSIGEIVNISSEREKSNDGKRIEGNKDSEIRSEDNMSIDEFDVEAQMKRITGDDGNDYKEKVDTSSEKDKSMDGIEGLMESSKEDSESEDRDIDDTKYNESSFKLFNISNEENFKEFERKSAESTSLSEDDVKANEKPVVNNESSSHQKIDQTSNFVVSSEESIFESTSSNMDTESALEAPKMFHSIPPLSERIRKKIDPSGTTKTQLNFKAAIIESTIDMETEEVCKNGEKKSMLSTALRELLEAKLEEETSGESKTKVDNDDNNGTSYKEIISLSPENSGDVKDTIGKCGNSQETHLDDVIVKQDEIQPKEIKRLKDPRTVVPNNIMPAPSTYTSDILPPVKRKVRTVGLQ